VLSPPFVASDLWLQPESYTCTASLKPPPRRALHLQLTAVCCRLQHQKSAQRTAEMHNHVKTISAVAAKNELAPQEIQAPSGNRKSECAHQRPKNLRFSFTSTANAAEMPSCLNCHHAVVQEPANNGRIVKHIPHALVPHSPWSMHNHCSEAAEAYHQSPQQSLLL